MNVILDNNPTDGGDPAGTLGKGGTPPVALVLAATVSPKLVPPVHEQRMTPPTSNVLDGVRVQLVAQVATVEHVLVRRAQRNGRADGRLDVAWEE